MRTWRVKSSTSDKIYTVAKINEAHWECTCPYFTKKHKECKHIRLVRDNNSLPRTPKTEALHRKLDELKAKAKRDPKNIEKYRAQAIPIVVGIKAIAKEDKTFRSEVAKALF